MIVLDATIVNRIAAPPSIKKDLGFTESSLAWVVEPPTCITLRRIPSCLVSEGSAKTSPVGRAESCSSLGSSSSKKKKKPSSGVAASAGFSTSPQ
jgi:hypothetical protein